MENHLEILQQRYPDIAFYLTVTPIVPLPFFQKEKEFQEKESLEEIEVLYIYGIGLGHYFLELKEWLKRKKGRTLIFIEHDLAMIDAMLKTAHANELLMHPQVHLKFLSNPQELDPFLEQLSHEFPTDRLEVAALELYRKKYSARLRSMRLKLMRYSASFFALFSEVLHSDRLFKNIYQNLRFLNEAFYANEWQGLFKNVPAIICGAGPSLKESIPTLQTLENQALIITGGSALSALTHRGILPHLAMALDPNPDELKHLKEHTAFEIPFLYANRLYPQVRMTCNGPFGYMSTQTGGLAEEWYENQLGLAQTTPIGPDMGREAFSVTTLAICFACLLGCNPIVLVGVDLAYTNMQRYAGGVLDDSKVFLNHLKKDSRVMENLRVKKDRFGNKVYTLLKWIMESDSISAYAKKHPEHLFLNATTGGIGFKQIPYRSLEEIQRLHCVKNQDLRGMIHAAIQEKMIFKNVSQNLQKSHEEMRESLRRTEMICKEYLAELTSHKRESAKMVLLSMSLEEEKAYLHLLQGIRQVTEKLSARYFPEEDALPRQRHLWQHLHSMVQNYLNIYAETLIESLYYIGDS